MDIFKQDAGIGVKMKTFILAILFSVSVLGAQIFESPVTMKSTLSVTGNSTLAGLNVTGDSNTATLSVTGNSTLAGLVVTGNSTTATLNVTTSASIGSSANATTSALLDLTSTSKGLLFPRMTTTQRDNITDPANGLMIYNTTTDAANIYAGGAWGAVGGGGTWDSSSSTSLAEGGTISLVASSLFQVFRVASNATTITLSTTPFTSTDPDDATFVILVGTSNSSVVQIPCTDVANGVIGNCSTIILTNGKSAKFQYLTTDDRWYFIE